VGRLLAKDESTRLGLGAFKGLGASWAVRIAVADHHGRDPLTVIAATDGNHGRAVARFARLLGHRADIYIPVGVHPTAAQNITDEGADLIRIDGRYDDAVAAARLAARAPGTVLVQDTAWAGYEHIPAAIIEAYDTLFHELDNQLDDIGTHALDLVLVPTGVGSLLQAAITHYRSDAGRPGTAVVSVEPEAAACVQASLATGTPVTIDTGTTIMSGLNCGTPSSTAWPFIENGLDAATTVSDTQAIAAAHTLAEHRVDAGPCGAATLAALEHTLTGRASASRRKHLRLGPGSTVVLLVTEGSGSNPVPS
jgi:diaminopropionate ammonia-lyase